MLLERFGRLLALHWAGQDAVIADDGVALTDHVGLGGLALVLHGMPFQPIVRHVVTAIEATKVMVRRQRRWSCDPATLCRMWTYFCQAGLRFISALRGSLGGRGLSSAWTNALYFSGSSTNWLLSSRTLIASLWALSSMNWLSVMPTEFAASSISCLS